MARTDEQVASILLQIYEAEFGGKQGQRYLITRSDIRVLYGFGKLTQSRFEKLDEAAVQKNLYLLDLGQGAEGHMAAIVKMGTVDRWRRVPRRIIEHYELPPDKSTSEPEDED